MIRELLRRSFAGFLALLLGVPQGLVGAAVAAETKAPAAEKSSAPAVPVSTASAPSPAQPPVAKAAAKPAPKPAKPASSALLGVELADDQVRLKLSAPARYRSSITVKPPRLVIDLIDVDHKLAVPAMAGRGKTLLRVRSSQLPSAAKPMTRVALDLGGQANYKVDTDGNDLIVSLIGGGAPAPEAPAAPRAPAPPPVAAAAPIPAPKAEPAPSRPKVKLPPAAAPAPAAAAAAVVMGDTTKVASPPQASEPGSMGTEVSPELSAMSPKNDPPAAVDPEAASSSDPASVAVPRELRGSLRVARRDLVSRLPKDRVTLDFDNTDVKDIIKLLAAKAKINMIYGSDVSGTLTLHLQDVPFDEAFRTTLSMMNLVTTQVGDSVLRILTQATLDKIQAATATGGMVSKVVHLHYGKAKDILDMVKDAKKAEGRAGGQMKDSTLLNALILTDTPEGLEATERLIAQVDIKPQQILIETKLVEITLGRDFHFGIQWDYWELSQGRALGKNGVTTFGTDVAPNANPFSQPYNEGVLKVTPPGSGGTSARGTGVNLPASSIFGAFTLGRVANNLFVNAAITAAAVQGKAKILSDPKIATLNNKEAKFNLVTSFPYSEAVVASGGGTTQNTKFLEAGIKLTVTPTVNADGRITLDIEPEVSKPTPGPRLPGTAPPLDKRYAKTFVIVKDGETIVLGGLISDSLSNDVSKIPFFGDLPLLGWLFKKKSVVRSRTELLIFVTPRILGDS